MALDEAEIIVRESYTFNTINGRILQICLRDNGFFDSFYYNAHNGIGAAEKVICEIESNGGDVNSKLIRDMHTVGLRRTLNLAREEIGSRGSLTEENGVVMFKRGLAHLADKLTPALARFS